MINFFKNYAHRLLGLTNNFAYVIMLTAAHDILDTDSDNSTNNKTMKISFQAILLADILPTLVVKLVAPLYLQSIPYSILVSLVVILGAASFPIVAFAGSKLVWLSLTGVVFASLGAGLGEITFLSLSTHFDKNSVSTWSSGTGAAGIFGALSYAGLRAIGVSSKTTILLMLVIPVVMAMSYFVLIIKPESIKKRQRQVNSSEDDEEREALIPHSPIQGFFGYIKYFLHFQPLLKFMIPLGTVYFAEYFINQALFELVYFEDSWLSVGKQYAWYQVLYQVGVFISRSSVNLIQIKKIWIFPILQVINVVIFLLQIFLHFNPSIIVIFVLILYEGLLGGGAYVNTFYRISTEIPADVREYSMGVASVCNSIGIALSGAVAVPVRNYICTL
ncbi:hypothetical protein CAPTEDRAFT_128152 [Capitella teleta]|uniref:Battenin n=1 Tax=Capitella teleta TaxID=283909 RepID=R7U3S9_CAPTE|nr:hypothetical protein CAPTEDRAFT_128152 [Capitella teleta]|eukprot:ELU00649.1 hypothetical protein CAPTEDRAFT_128152 [Capitella teleta]